MGFSVSGSVAIVSIGALVAFGVMFPAVVDSTQQVGDAQSAQSDRILDQQNTDVTVELAAYDADAEELVVRVANDGTTALEVEETDAIVDGEYRTLEGTTVYATLEDAEAGINGNEDTDVWLAGEVLEMTFTGVTDEPDGVKVVTETGVADRTGEVS